MSVNDARAWLLERLERGETCPVCQQHAQLYRRTIHAGMARSLIAIYQAAGGSLEWVHVPTAVGARSREEGKLAYWRLLEGDDGPGRAGYWRLTELGRRFARGEAYVAAHAVVYNGRVLELEGDPVTIRDALGTRFDLDELLAGAPHADTPRNLTAVD